MSDSFDSRKAFSGLTSETATAMPTAQGETCAMCKFYRVEIGNVKQGFCRRNPPAVSAVPAGAGRVQFVSQQATTPKDGWCGEFKIRLAITN